MGSDLIPGPGAPYATGQPQKKKETLLTDYFFVFLPFLGPHSWHMEVPRLGVQSELLLRDLSLGCNLHTAHGNTGSLTHWARPGIEPATSRFLVGFINHWAMVGTLTSWIYTFKNFLTGVLGIVLKESKSTCVHLPWFSVIFLNLSVSSNSTRSWHWFQQIQVCN